MKFEARVGERGEIVIPEEVRAELRLEPETKVAVQVLALDLSVTNTKQDMVKAREIAAKVRDEMRANLLSEGYATFDEYIDDIRGR